MQFDDNNKRLAIQAFNQLPDSVRSQMQLSSVRLANGNFTGSGVLVIDSEGIPGILTAKHNLCARLGKEAPIDWNQTDVNNLVFGFLEGLEVGYGPLTQPIAPGNLPEPTEKVTLTSEYSDIEFRCAANTWDYDLMFISFKDIKHPAPLVPPPVPPPVPLLTYMANTNHRIQYKDKDDRKFYEENIANLTGNVFVTGFGSILFANGQGNSGTHPFQVRTAKVTEKLDKVRRHEKPDADFTDVLIVTATDQTSTAGGDSGGPMFYVAKNKVYLLGATLGSNYRPKNMPPNKPISNNASTYLFRDGKLF